VCQEVQGLVHRAGLGVEHRTGVEQLRVGQLGERFPQLRGRADEDRLELVYRPRTVSDCGVGGLLTAGSCGSRP
jgi:hypothetical protein